MPTNELLSIITNAIYAIAMVLFLVIIIYEVIKGWISKKEFIIEIGILFCIAMFTFGEKLVYLL